MASSDPAEIGRAIQVDVAGRGWDGMEQIERIDLAHVPGFRLGRLTVCPAVRQLLRDDGAEEVLQPRVMQVLIALARANGAIVTRDALTESCWDGRIVGEDAINRILSHLRAVTTGIGAGSFRIETITRVGYRMLREGQQAPEKARLAERGFGRRALLVGAGGAALLGLAGTVWHWGDRTRDAPSPEVQALMQQALNQLSQNTREGKNQAIGLYRRVVALAPDYADGWGALGCAYAATAFFLPAAQSDAVRARAMAAGRRALALDPDNGYGQTAVATAVPARGCWLGMDRALRHALAQHPENLQLLFANASLMSAVGRNLDALPILDRLGRLMPVTPPDVYFLHVNALWGANRLEEADRLVDAAAAVYPTHFAIWFVRFYLLLYSGRAGAAAALAQDQDGLPSNIPHAEFEDLLRTAQAIGSRAAPDIDQVLAAQVAQAHRGAGFAEHAIQFAGAVGRTDAAIALANAYYFGRGFVVPDVRFTAEQGTYSPQRDRLTGFLFLPHMRELRADSRFRAIVTEWGLTQYWTSNGTLPDYQRG